MVAFNPILWRALDPDGNAHDFTRRPENVCTEVAWATADGRATIYYGDCLDVMRSMPDGSVDAVVTDPPYGLDFKGEEWDAFIPAWLGEARRVSRGPVVFTTAPTTLWDYPRPDWLLCWQRPAAQSRTIYGTFNHWSPIPVYGKGSWNPDCYRLDGNSAFRQSEGVEHPSPKPVSMVRWLIRGACEPGGTVLDPFLGSGTTLVAALQEGCKGIGIEREAPYVEIAKARVAHEAAQGSLFSAVENVNTAAHDAAKGVP